MRCERRWRVDGLVYFLLIQSRVESRVRLGLSVSELSEISEVRWFIYKVLKYAVLVAVFGIDFLLGLSGQDLRPFLLWRLVRIFRLQSILCVQVVALHMFLGLGTSSCLHDIARLGVLLAIFHLLLVAFLLGCLVMLLSLPFCMTYGNFLLSILSKWFISV